MNRSITAVIIDDEEKARRGLRKLLDMFCPEVEIIGEVSNIIDAKKLVDEVRPELLFLDVQMPNGNGFNLLKQFDKLPFDVIFVTGFDMFAINAIKFSALDYLLKPVEVNLLINAVNKAIVNKVEKNDKITQLLNLLNLTSDKQLDKRIVVHQNDKVVLVKVDSIKFIEADDRYSHIHSIHGERFTVTKTLKEFEEFFVENEVFLRINKNFIVNLNQVKDYSKGEPCFIKLYDDTSFEISRRKKQEFLERIRNKSNVD